MPNIKYPERIENVVQLNIFMDYVIHEFIDSLSYPVEFHGVKTREVFVTKTVVISVPVKVPKERHTEFRSTIRPFIDDVVKKLKDKAIFIGLHIAVQLGIDYLGSFNHYILSEEEKGSMYVPEVEKIIHKKSDRGEFFSVIWKDNTKTTVKLAEGEESDEYTAFCYALCKKLFEDKGKVRELIKSKKKVFEDEVAERQYNLNRQRKMMAVQQSLNAREDFDDIEAEVYGEMFVAPALISRSVFRRNKGEK